MNDNIEVNQIRIWDKFMTEKRINKTFIIIGIKDLTYDESDTTKPTVIIRYLVDNTTEVFIDHYVTQYSTIL
jgi:hypothetical protein